MHIAIVTPAIIAPAIALTNAAAIGCAEPKTAPRSPATTANATRIRHQVAVFIFPIFYFYIVTIVSWTSQNCNFLVLQPKNTSSTCC